MDKPTTPDETARLRAFLTRAARLTGAHYGLWLAGATAEAGLEAALAAEAEAGDRLAAIASARLLKVLDEHAPEAATALRGLDGPALSALADALGTLWLAADGVWFQALENARGMAAAKAVNDGCWAVFAPLEARRIMAASGIQGHGGLDALEQALQGRIYARVNDFGLTREPGGALLLETRTCRVQAARRRKGLADYPCKSGGLVEYSGFARAVDQRIRAECVCCPPDPLPDGVFCSWRFTLVA